jgi:uncharacterized membrane protein (DUF485 family)
MYLEYVARVTKIVGFGLMLLILSQIIFGFLLPEWLFRIGSSSQNDSINFEPYFLIQPLRIFIYLIWMLFISLFAIFASGRLDDLRKEFLDAVKNSQNDFSYKTTIGFLLLILAVVLLSDGGADLLFVRHRSLSISRNLFFALHTILHYGFILFVVNVLKAKKALLG